MLSSLNERQRTAVTLRFGLDGSPSRSLEETGTLMSLTRERVRQLLNEAFRMIRSLEGIHAMRAHIRE
ncbi:MAG: sigma factor-like helix-turn-helix DNA-binding protein [Spirochaetota bacterium]